MMRTALTFLLLTITLVTASAQPKALTQYNLTWHTQSKNSGESMPCGGGDIGLNVWVENNQVYCYLSQSGAFDENNTFLKMGRIKVSLSPNPFEGNGFSQQLNLSDGSVIIKGKNNTQVKFWVDVYRPVVHIEINSKQSIKTEAAYESWRYRDRDIASRENNQGSWKWAKVKAKILKDSIRFDKNAVTFYHQNKDTSVFDFTVRQQGLLAYKQQLYNPLHHLIFGGTFMGDDMRPAGTYTGKYLNTDFTGWKLQSTKAKTTQNLQVVLNTAYANTTQQWQQKLDSTIRTASSQKQALKATQTWWKTYWERSFIFIDNDEANTNKPEWQAGRNYQLFRYMLGCNALGKWPTKFNGGLFTVDPELTDTIYKFTPDFPQLGRRFNDGSKPALVYFPMLKSGDVDMMKPQFDFYQRAIANRRTTQQGLLGP
jgi:hypothetical protein